MLKNFCLASLGQSIRQSKGIAAAIAAMGILVPSFSLAAPTVAVAQTMSLAPDNLPRSVMGTAGGRAAIPGGIVPSRQSSASCLGFASPNSNSTMPPDG